jgi:hypothetical protein
VRNAETDFTNPRKPYPNLHSFSLTVGEYAQTVKAIGVNQWQGNQTAEGLQEAKQ